MGRVSNLVAICGIVLCLVSCSTEGDYPSCEERYGFEIAQGDVILLSQKQVNHFDRSRTKINGSLYIGYCSGEGSGIITNLNWLSSITEIGGSLYIVEANLTSLEGLNNLRKIGKELNINDSTIRNLKGLENLTEVGLSVNLSQMENLESLDGLQNLKTIGGLGLWANPKLQNLDALSNITNFNGRLSISHSASLDNIEGLGNVQNGVISYLNVQYNQELKNLKGLTNFRWVGPEAFDSDIGNLTIINNPQLQFIGEMNMQTTTLNNIEVRWNLSLKEIRGILGIVKTNGLLWITDNPELKDLTGLSDVARVGGSLAIYNNDALTTLDGLESIDKVEATLTIMENDLLSNLCGLTPLLQTDNGLKYGLGVNNIPYFQISDNAYNPLREDLENGNCVE